MPGQGALATVEGQRLAVGNARLLHKEGVALHGLTGAAAELSGQGRTVVQVAWTVARPGCWRSPPRHGDRGAPPQPSQRPVGLWFCVAWSDNRPGMTAHDNRQSWH